MKTLILNGSPRARGTISSMMDEALAACGEGAELIRLYDCRIRPCTACMRCRQRGVCSLPPDDGHVLAGKIREADLLIVGSPTHWGNMSSALKNLFDRTVPVFMGESPGGIPVARQKGKQAVIVAACSTPFPFNILMHQSRGAVRSIREVLGTAGYHIRTLEIPGTKNRRELPARYPARLRKMLRRIFP